jgi:hypothetical protein
MRPRPSTLPESTSRPSFFLSAPAIAPRTVCGCQESASAGPSQHGDQVRVSQTLEPPWYGPVCLVVGELRLASALISVA